MLAHHRYPSVTYSSPPGKGVGARAGRGCRARCRARPLRPAAAAPAAQLGRLGCARLVRSRAAAAPRRTSYRGSRDRPGQAPLQPSAMQAAARLLSEVRSRNRSQERCRGPPPQTAANSNSRQDGGQTQRRKASIPPLTSRTSNCRRRRALDCQKCHRSRSKIVASRRRCCRPRRLGCRRPDRQTGGPCQSSSPSRTMSPRVPAGDVAQRAHRAEMSAGYGPDAGDRAEQPRLPPRSPTGKLQIMPGLTWPAPSGMNGYHGFLRSDTTTRIRFKIRTAPRRAAGPISQFSKRSGLGSIAS